MKAESSLAPLDWGKIGEGAAFGALFGAGVGLAMDTPVLPAMAPFFLGIGGIGVIAECLIQSLSLLCTFQQEWRRMPSKSGGMPTGLGGKLRP